MSALREYEARLDAKRRLTLRRADADRFRVVHRGDGSIILQPLVVMERAAARQARLDTVLGKAKATGEKIPRGVKLISFREPTAAELAGMDAVARELGLTRKRRRGA